MSRRNRSKRCFPTIVRNAVCGTTQSSLQRISKRITAGFKRVVEEQAKQPFPSDPLEQLELASMAVFRSSNGKRAQDYRNAAGIAHDLGTAVNVCTMVFGNMGNDSGTGVMTTRNVELRRKSARRRFPH